MSRPVFRFAPSPNGYLHVGHARSALLNFEQARAYRGRFLLRIEDIDTTRCRPEFEYAILEDLGWLGLSWEQPVWRQSQNFAAYRAALDRLDALGLLYRASESRAAFAARVAAFEACGTGWPRDPDGVPLYPGPGPRLHADADHPGDAALRLDMTRAAALAGPLQWDESGAGPRGETATLTAAPMDWGDVVLARKDVPTSYHLAVVVDDAAQGVTDIVRGQDLFWATSVHRLLQHLLDLPVPRYHHHSLVLDQHGRKLAKSSGATALRALRAGGADVADIRRAAGLA